LNININIKLNIDVNVNVNVNVNVDVNVDVDVRIRTVVFFISMSYHHWYMVLLMVHLKKYSAPTKGHRSVMGAPCVQKRAAVAQLEEAWVVLLLG
jgi:hypothetical protein